MSLKTLSLHLAISQPPSEIHSQTVTSDTSSYSLYIKGEALTTFVGGSTMLMGKSLKREQN